VASDDKLWRLSWEQLYALQEAHQVIDGDTGQVKQMPVDPRLWKQAVSTIIMVERRVEQEMGQQVAPNPSVGSSIQAARLGGHDGKGGLDYRQLVERRHNRERQQQEEEAAREAVYAREIDAQRLENAANLDGFCYDFLAKAVAQCGPGVINDPDFRADLKDQFPQEEWAQAEVDRWLAAIDAQVAAIRAADQHGGIQPPSQASPEPVHLAVVHSESEPEPSAFVASVAAASRGVLTIELDAESAAELEWSPLRAVEAVS
jgi:hypothetical protein